MQHLRSHSEEAMDSTPHALHGSHTSLSSGCVLAMHNMKQLDLCDTWGPARVQCSVDLQVLDMRFVRPEPHTGVSDMRCLMVLSDGLHTMRGMLHDTLSTASESVCSRARSVPHVGRAFRRWNPSVVVAPSFVILRSLSRSLSASGAKRGFS